MVDNRVTRYIPQWEVQEEIAKALWKTPAGKVPELDIYFKYYAKQCDNVVLQDGGLFTSVKTHQDILRVAKFLKEPLGREEVSCRISAGTGPTVPDSEQCSRSIDLVGRLLLMVELGSFDHAPALISPPTGCQWNEGTIKEHISHCFPASPVLGHDGVKLGSIFNAPNLETIAGIEILWTDNLADHLRLTNNDKQVAVFHHASFLLRQQRWVLGGRLGGWGLVGASSQYSSLLIMESQLVTSLCTHENSSTRPSKQSSSCFPNGTRQRGHGTGRKWRPEPLAISTRS